MAIYDSEFEPNVNYEFEYVDPYGERTVLGLDVCENVYDSQLDCALSCCELFLKAMGFSMNGRSLALIEND